MHRAARFTHTQAILKRMSSRPACLVFRSSFGEQVVEAERDQRLELHLQLVEVARATPRAISR